MIRSSLNRSHSVFPAFIALALAFASAASASAVTAKSLVIIAPTAFGAPLADYRKFKQSQLPTELVSLEDILRTTAGADDPERLKRFLFDQWKRHDAAYVLLVGDADVMPMRYMVLDRCTPEAFDYAFYASDLYYGDVAKPDGSFEDWNANKEGFHARYFGEVRGEKNKSDPINFDHVDYNPELAVGRWPVSTPEEVKIVADKSMKYEQAVLKGDQSWPHTAALLACGGWVDGRDLMDRMAAKLPGGWTVQKRYDADQKRNDQTPAPNEKQAVELLNSGVGVMIHIGHGGSDSWAGSLSLHSLENIKNADKLPIMLSAGCGTAVCSTQAPYEAYVDIDGKEHAGTNGKEVFSEPPPPPSPYQRGRCNPTSLGEQLLRRGPDGAVAYIGCNTGGQPCALTLMEGFVDGMKNESSPRLGDCWNHAVRFYLEHEHVFDLKPTADWYPPSVFYQPMKYMVFGDPSLPIAH